MLSNFKMHFKSKFENILTLSLQGFVVGCCLCLVQGLSSYNMLHLLKIHGAWTDASGKGNMIGCLGYARIILPLITKKIFSVLLTSPKMF